jgi:Flp pilus assembly protein TadB
MARKRKSETVDVEDLRRSYSYFMDEKRSVQWLKEQQGTLVFEEIEGEDEKNVMDQSWLGLHNVALFCLMLCMCVLAVFATIITFHADAHGSIVLAAAVLIVTL